MTRPTTPTFNQTHTALKFEPEAFREYVQGMGLTLVQQDALLETVWLIIVGVIENHPFPELLVRAEALAADSPSMIASAITLQKPNTEDAAAGGGPTARKVDS